MHCLLADNWLPHRGGSRQYYHDLLAACPAGSFHVITATHPDAAVFDAAQPYTIERWPWPGDAGYGGLTRQAIHAVRLFRRLVALRPECVHVGDALPSGLAAYAYARHAGVPSVMYAHDEPLTPHLRVRTRVERMLYRHATRVVAASSWAHARLREEGVAEECIVGLPPVVDVPAFEAVRAARAGRQGAATVITICRLVPHKGVDVLLDAMAAVRREIPAARVLIVGDGPERGALERRAACDDLDGAVQFCGPVNNAERAMLLAQADVFVLASRPRPDGTIREGVGIAVLEAAACGVPVVVSRLGGLCDSVIEGVTGVAVPPDGPAALADAIRQLLSNPEQAQRMGAAACAHVSEHFALQAQVKRFAALLTELCAS